VQEPEHHVVTDLALPITHPWRWTSDRLACRRLRPRPIPSEPSRARTRIGRSASAT